MAERTFWVQIQTETDNLDNPDKAEMYHILREPGKYGIVDIVDEDDIMEIVYK